MSDTNQGNAAPSTSSELPLSIGDALASAGSGERFSFKDEVEASNEAQPDPAASTTGDAPTGEPENTQPNQSAAAVADDDDIPAELIAEFALDAKNPNQRKALLAIAALRKNGEAVTETPADEPEELTEFEKSLLQPAKPEANADPNANKETPAETKPLEPGKYGDVGDAWTGPVDAYEALNAAYAAGDLNLVAQIDHAMFIRRAEAMVMPMIKNMAQSMFRDMLREQLGDLPEKAKADRQARDQRSNRAFAVEELKKTKGFSDIKSLLEPIDDTTIKYQGKEFENSPINQVLSQMPELLSLRENHPDKNTAQRLTEMKLLRAVHRIWNQQQKLRKSLPADKAGQIFQAGAESARKPSPADRTRQTLNSGNGASGNGPAGDPNKDWFSRGANPGALSISDLI